MKIKSISSANFNMGLNNLRSKRKNGDNSNYKIRNNDDVLGCIPCYYPINFLGVHGGDISKVRKLFQYNIPDMYSERVTIDPKQLSRWVKGGLFLKPAKDVLKVFSQYPESFISREADLLKIIAERATVHPNMTMNQILQEIKPVYSRMLRKEQTPVFHQLWEEFETLPQEYRKNFHVLLEKSERMLNDKPVVIPFSSYEFRYKLSKIAEYVNAGFDAKAKRTMTKLMKESMRFENTTNAENIEYQKKVLAFINHIRRRSVLKGNEQLRNLYLEANARLNRNEMVVPFRRKSFIYDLVSIIESLPDEECKRKIIEIAQKLPTSSQSFPAFIMKNAAESDEKIGYKLVWPSISTIEHLLPRSCGGLDEFGNLGIASAFENSDRKSMDFVLQLQRRPKTPEYTQRQFDKLIELANGGIFDALRIDISYITDYANTIYELSQHSFRPDLSALMV